MTSDERLASIKQKLQNINEEITELYDFIAIIEALTKYVVHKKQSYAILTQGQVVPTLATAFRSFS